MNAELFKEARFLPLLSALNEARQAEGRVILAIDGGSASGKSTLAKVLADGFGATVFHTDDFFPQAHQRTRARLAEAGGNLDRERLQEEVLLPLSRGEKTLRFRRFDCKKMALSEFESVQIAPLVIVEGAYSMHPDLQGFYTHSLFLKTSPETQRARILARNTPEAAERFFSVWIPMERRYFEAFDIESACDFSVCNE